MIEPSSSPPRAAPVGPSRRHAFCPLCGLARIETPVSELHATEDAVCPGRCTAAWHALAALRQRESLSERLAARRRDEYQSGTPHLPPLSDLLLIRWRAGDWRVAPDDVLLRVQAGEAAASMLGE